MNPNPIWIELIEDPPETVKHLKELSGSNAEMN